MEDYQGHEFLSVYTSPLTYIVVNGSNQSSMDEYFAGKLSEVAAMIVDHKCGPDSITYPTLGYDNKPGGFINSKAGKTEDVQVYDGAVLCGGTFADARNGGKILIRGPYTILDDSYLLNESANDMVIENVSSKYTTFHETEDLHTLFVKDSVLLNVTARDSIIEFSTISYVDVFNSTVNSVTMSHGGVTGFSLIQNAEVRGTCVSGGSQILEATVLNSTISNATVSGSYISSSNLYSGTKVESSTVVSSTLTNTTMRSSYIVGCKVTNATGSGYVCVQ